MSNTKSPEIVAPPQNGTTTTTNTNNHHQIDEGENDGKKMGTKMAVPANVIDEGPSPFVQPGVAHKKLMATRIHFLDDTEHTFHVHQKAKGSVLTSLVAAQLELREKDYFGLAYYDEQKLQHWLYPDKRIKKQLKGLPLKFWFQVKFYPPQPTQLTEDLTRFLLYLQLRRDVHTERLPVSFAAQANLGAFIAQAMLGDYQESDEYADHLNSAHIAQPTTEQEQFIGHVRELHRQHRGLTPQEAELGYLNACKVLAMYGVHLYPAKDGKGKSVQIGISSHGISVFSEQMRVHRFAWPGIIKFSHRRHYFSIKLKAGEVDPKKETSLTYTLIGGKEHAKLLWECAVEHHGFFRLIQPDRKLKHHHLFGFGSARFRYVGRTNIQSQMASQLFEAPSIDEHVKSSKSADQIVVKSGPAEHSSPLNYADETTPQKAQQQQNQREQRDSVTHQQLHEQLKMVTMAATYNNHRQFNNNNTNKNVFDPNHQIEELTFHCPELPHTHIEQCVSLYSTGLYDDLLLLGQRERRGQHQQQQQQQRRHDIDNGTTAKNCATNAASTKFLPTKLLLSANKPWTTGRRRRWAPASKKAAAQVPPPPSISKLISAPCHRPYAATVLRHIRPAQEMESLPLRYFVGITHSGHSVTPFRGDDCWAKHHQQEEHGSEETVVEQHKLNPDDYHLAAVMCFEPLQRVERANELETYPRRAYCRDVKMPKSVDERGEPLPIATRIGAILHLKSTNRTTNQWQPPPISVYNGPYKLLAPAEQLTQTDIEASICQNLQPIKKEGEEDTKNAAINAANANIVRHGSKKMAKIFVTLKSVTTTHEDQPATAAADNVNMPQIIITPTAQIVHELCPASELLSVPIGSCIDKQQKDGDDDDKSAANNNQLNGGEGGGKKFVAKITVTTSVITKGTVVLPTSSRHNANDEARDGQLQQQELHLLDKKDEFMGQPIEQFVAMTNKRHTQIGHDDDQQQKVKKTSRKKYAAKIVLKTHQTNAAATSKEAEKATNSQFEAPAAEWHVLSRQSELKCHPIGEFVALAKAAEQKRTDVEHDEPKLANCKKYNVKIVMKSPSDDHVVCPPTAADDECHLLRRHAELKCRPMGEFVAPIKNKLMEEGRSDEQKAAAATNGKKLTAKIVTTKTIAVVEQAQQQQQLLNAEHGFVKNEPQKNEHLQQQQEQLHSLHPNEELKCHPIADFVTCTASTSAAAATVVDDEASKKEELEQQNGGFPAVVVEEGKRLSRKRKRPSAKMALLEGFWQQIGISKDKQKKKGKKKKTEHEKKAKKQNGQQKAVAATAAATTTSASSSSSSSSSSDAEEIHVLVQDEEGKQQQQMPAINDQQQQQPQQHVHEGGTMVGEPPHTTTSVRTWHEQSSGPQRITTEVDEHGNVVRRVVTTEHVRHTVQTHSYQTKSAAGGEHGEGDGGGTTNAAATAANSTDDNANKVANAAADAVPTASPPRASLKSPPPVPPARRRSSATSPQAPQTGTAAGDGTTTITTSIVNGGTTTAVNGTDDVGELVATKVVTTGNRTIETLTYKKEQDGMVETRVEHRITIHSNEDIDHEAELDRAISEATKMNPHMKVEKVEVERTTTSSNNNSP
ncbi:hypothetical protein niasHT_017516 [Heterodera trifolii]|uniref:FERM domain-containing protein n=1 Tax=Heterodera trifolii TaxID=157864 RepID=A0ABD2L650_9BILA